MSRVLHSWAQRFAALTLPRRPVALLPAYATPACAHCGTWTPPGYRTQTVCRRCKRSLLSPQMQTRLARSQAWLRSPHGYVDSTQPEYEV